ncbi:MAG TPA: helix-turn-helix domain-containing protein [Terriglobales bacterium]|nr:helix-turn-helix domain-containing protein [Terriglobales bacterium]
MAEDTPKRIPARQKLSIAARLHAMNREGRAKRVRELAREIGVSERQIWRWLAAFEQRGTAAFLKQKRSDAGSSRFFRDNVGLELFAIAIFFSGAKSAKAIHAAMLRQFGLEIIPAVSTIEHYLKNVLERML